jgi:hypothetical protein
MAKKQKSYTVGRAADNHLAILAKLMKRTKGAVIEHLVAEAAKAHGIRTSYVALIDPEKNYPVTYAYHSQRGKVDPPASGMMKGKDLTAPQIEQLYDDGLI